MRPMYGCPENFRESLATVTATFAEIVNGHLLRSIILKCIPNLKFVALLAPKIVGGSKTIPQSPDTPMLPFVKNFNG